MTAVSCVAARYPGINTSVVPSGVYPSPTAPVGTSAGASVGTVSRVLPPYPTVSSVLPPYPTGTGSYYGPCTTGASGSAAPPRPTGVTRRGNGKIVPRFTGGGGRVSRSIDGFSFIALLGFVLACGWFL